MADGAVSNAHIRTVQLYDAKLSLQIVSTSSNFEDLMVIWLDSEHELTLENYVDINAKIRSIANYFEIFTNIEECIDYISSMIYEKVFLVVSLNRAEQLVSLIHDLPQIAYIYICKKTQEEDVAKPPFVRLSMYELNGNFLDELRHDMESVRSHLLPFTLLSSNRMKNNSIRDLNKDQVAYRWSQLLLAALRKFPQNDRSKQDILNECKAQYRDNKQELEKITQFEETYQPQLAVWWYTRDCFLYKLLNKALRTEDIDCVFKFRFFITDLYNQLIDLYNQSKSNNSSKLTVYRGQQLAHDEFEVFKLNINGFISMNTFLSTTKNKDVALIYAGDGSERPLFESVLFEMIIDVNSSDQPFADISKISHMLHEDEILLSIGMMYTIDSVENIDNDVWKVTLTLINDTDIPMNDYHTIWKREIEEDDMPLLCFGKLLFEMGQYDKEEKYYLMLLDEGSDDYGPIYNNLGLCYYAKHNYRRALHYYTKAINYTI